jgi:hypothetical protein
MGFRLNAQRTETLVLKTKREILETAQRLKDLGGTECEREEKEKRKQRIKDKILGGEMTTFRWCVGRVVCPGKPLVDWFTRRVNGQHSSLVFLELAPEEWAIVQFPQIVVWEEYDCDKDVDLAVLFEQFDPQWSDRKDEDRVGVHLGIYADLRQSVSRTVGDKVTAGIAWYQMKVHNTAIKGDERHHLIHTMSGIHSFLRWCGTTFHDLKRTPPEMLRKEVVAAIYQTAWNGDQEAREFWTRIHTGKTSLDVDMIEYKLIEFLESVRLGKDAEWPKSVSRHFPEKGVKPTDDDVFATCLNAFAAKKSGRKIGDVFLPAKGKAKDKAKEILAALKLQPVMA